MRADRLTPGGVRGSSSTRAVYLALRKGSRASRSALARATSLSEPTVFAAVDRLIRSGVAREVGYGDSSGGRKPMLLETVPDSRYAVAVDLAGATLRCALVSIGGTVVETVEGCALDPEVRRRLTDEIVAAIHSMSGLDRCRDRIVGAGVAMPGVTDPTTGNCLLAPIFGADALYLRDVLADRLGLRVFVENEANASALAEVSFGGAADSDPFVLLSTGTGIGAGIVVHGELLRGNGFAAGEVGYLVVDRHWTPQVQDGFGCFESLASEAAVVQRARRMIMDGYSTQIGRDKASGKLSFGDVVSGIRAGDPLGRHIMNEVAEYFAIGLANITAVLSPELVTIAGGFTRIGDEFLAAVQGRLGQLVPRSPTLRFSGFGDTSGLVGAAAVVFNGMGDMLFEDVPTVRVDGTTQLSR